VNSRELALLFGIFYAGLGLLGLMPGNSALLGLLPDNLPLALLHLTMGAWALAAYFGHGSTQSYARSAAFILAALGLMGMVDGLDTFFGLMPLYGANVWLHLFSAALAGFVGWSPQTGERRGLAGDRRRAVRAFATERREGSFDRRSSAYIPTA